MSTSPFQYDPLPDGSIRLLTVLGDDTRGGIECKLDVKPLTGTLEFYTLSYVWGSHLTDRTILCNDESLAVTQSVHEAVIALLPVLQRDRLPIWIDAVCINQADHHEKEREVSHMGEIYRASKMVIVWLGLEAQNSAIAMRHVESFANLLPKIAQPPSWAALEIHGLRPQEHPVWPAIGHLYRRPWFGRLWTFQESVLAQTCKAFCGSESVDWEHLSQVGSELNRTQLFRLAVADQDLSGTENGFRAAADVSWAKSFRKMVGDDLAMLRGKLDPQSPDGISYSKRFGYIPLSSLLMVSQHKLCDDGRDHVYGMISLTSQEFRKQVPVSYAKHPYQLYLETGKACLNQDKSLTYLQLSAGRTRSPNLPTWCIDLSATVNEILPFDVYLMSGVKEAINHTSEATIHAFSEQDYIETVGFRTDIVDCIVPPGGSFRTGPLTDRQARLYAWLQKCLRLAESINRKHPNVDTLLAYVYAVTANTVSRVPEGEALKLAFQDNMQVFASQITGAVGDKAYWPPLERLSLFHDTETQIYRAASGRAYFTTVRGRIGIGPPDVRPGDVVIVIYGARPVFVLREKAGLDAFEFVGDAFVHGLMELKRLPEDEIGREETFRIV